MRLARPTHLEVAPMFRVLRAVCVLVAVVAAGAASAEPLTAQQAVRLALERNPDVRTTEEDLVAAKARLAGASLLLQSNPGVTASAGPRSSPAGRTRDHSVQILQQIEIGGQRGARMEAAKAAVESSQARVQAARAEVAGRVRESFGRALGAEQRVRLAAETLGLAQQGVAAAEERFAAGAAALIEVNTARVELGRAGRDKGEAERRRAEAAAELHLLAALDPGDMTLEGDLASPEPAETADGRVEEALANRGEILASRRALDAAKAELRLAAREWIPSPRIGASYTREEESGTRIVQGVVSIDVPVFNRNKAARGVAAARVSQLETAVAATERRVRQEVITATARLQAARGAADGYAGGVVKAMQENMDLAAESYRAGKIDFLQLLVIRRQTLDARREYIDVLEERSAARAQLDRALGRVH